MIELNGKIALVTGTTGIARATALRFAALGADVLALGIDEIGNVALVDAGIAVRRTDVSVPQEVDAAMADIVTRFGGLDIVVNSAAVHPYGDAVTTSPEVFARCLAVNVGSIHLTAHFGVPEMRKRGGGAIVNVSSVQGHACQQGVAAYVASKGAIHALTRAMALDFAGDRIRVLSVSPGSVRTPILELAARTLDGPEADVEAVFARFGAAHPIGRIGEADEVADLIAFLASSRAGFITGSDHVIDGGLLAGLGVR
ncbi:SDR family oxidoreductase [Lichenihabitans sp. PAMC28606]|uniref:SDR family NAD(P)-dependent oxidoreductase n=1 Tax=Lichenihabitans sp. PAMC28606 TaxID=2880932 RepID=UPI001D0B4C93|nr:SDR family oxidoreductase [Lichenihabitans sp. PAMC28606]UDL93293.1 SDR family oxidoreductase [Lichenihabitans sp. PAMC28606]